MQVHECFATVDSAVLCRFLPVDLPAQLSTGRRILFIGDSFTAGLGILGDATCLYYDAVGTLENAYLTYASLAALQLDSDYQVAERTAPHEDLPRHEFSGLPMHSSQHNSVFFSEGSEDMSQAHLVC